MLRIITVTLLSFASLFFTPHLQAQVNHVPIQAELGSSDHLQIAEALYTALIDRDYTRAQELLAPDFIYYASGGDSLDSQGMIDMWKGYDQTSSNSSMNLFSTAMQVPQGAFAGEFVLAWVQASWTEDISGQRVSTWIHEIFQIRDGKIALMYNYQDNLSIVLQSGFTLTPPASASAEK